jgi:SNF2 family DNA or RNA helicase
VGKLVEIVENRILLFRTRSPEKYQLIPRSKVVGEPLPGVYELAVKWGLDEVKILRNLGVKNAPSPIQGEYTWPGRHKPFEHQIKTASFLTLNQRAYCFNEAGTGKSAACLWAADYLMTKKMVRRCLIVCPLSIMESAWMKDIMTFVIHRSAAIAHSYSAEKRIEVVNNRYDFVIVNYDGVESIAKAVRNSEDFDLVILDEANFIKNASTRRWKAINVLLHPHTRIWALTGTPAPQSPIDAFGLARMVTPETIPKFITSWRDKTMLRVSQFKWIPKNDAPKIVYNALQPAIRFTKEQCLDLPEIVTSTRKVPLTAQQEKYYKLMRLRAVMEAAGQAVTAVNAASVISKLLQISAGATYTDDKETVVFDCAPRCNALLEVLQETERKVLVFANFKHSIETIVQILGNGNITCESITGDVTANKRSDIFNKFQNAPDPRVLVIQPQAAAHGVTLTRADTVVFWGPVMSVEMYIQCIARAHRIGQDSNKVNVIHLQSSEVEAKMFQQLERKIDNHNAIVQLYEEVLRG